MPYESFKLSLLEKRTGSFFSSLFVKIFMWFIAALTITVLLGTLAAYLTHNHITKTEISTVLQEVVQNNAETITALYSEKDKEKASELEDNIARTTRVKMLILSERTLMTPPEETSFPLPREFINTAASVLSSDQPHIEFKKSMAFYMAPVKSENGEKYIVTGFRRLPPPLFRRGATRSLVLNILLVLITGAAACYWLANHLTSPVKELREATLRLSEGDLSRRVDPSVLKRRDELGELARNFNAMAEKLEELVTAQKRLMRDISHELRSPLTRLNLSLDLARKKSPPERDKYLDRIEKESLEMNSMIAQVLSLARMETEPGYVNMKYFDLSDLASSIARDANFEGAAKACRVLMETPGVIHIMSDPELIGRALENITRNAVRHSAEGSDIEISLESLDSRVRMTVRDHGKGVEENKLEKIFTPFYRLDESRNRTEGGTGLGLAIAERAIKLLGGTIRAFNQKEGGLAVEITLPKNSKGPEK